MRADDRFRIVSMTERVRAWTTWFSETAIPECLEGANGMPDLNQITAFTNVQRIDHRIEVIDKNRLCCR